MKLLLTSAGISNASIAKALFELVGKKPEETSLVFIPTAANVEMGDKDWLIDDLLKLKQLNLKSIDIADISAVDEKIWRLKFEAADVMFFEGGNTYHLMRWMDRSGLAALMPEFLKTKLYVGVSAGSMVACPDLSLKLSQVVYEEDMAETEGLKGLELVPFYFLPHLNSPWFKNLREDFVRDAASGMKENIYVMDDQSALKIIDDTRDVVSEGKWFILNQ